MFVVGFISHPLLFCVSRFLTEFILFVRFGRMSQHARQYCVYWCHQTNIRISLYHEYYARTHNFVGSLMAAAFYLSSRCIWAPKLKTVIQVPAPTFDCCLSNLWKVSKFEVRTLGSFNRNITHPIKLNGWLIRTPFASKNKACVWNVYFSSMLCESKIYFVRVDKKTERGG